MPSLPQSPQVGYVYLIRMGETNYHKVGISRISVTQRLAHLQTSNPVELTLLAYYDQRDPIEIERSIHKALKSYHARGEWFCIPTQEVLRIFHDFNTMALVDTALERTNEIDVSDDESILELVRRGLSANKVFEIVGGTRGDVLEKVRIAREKLGLN